MHGQQFHTLDDIPLHWIYPSIHDRFLIFSLEINSKQKPNINKQIIIDFIRICHKLSMNKSRHLPSALFLQLTILTLVLSISTLCSNYFKNSPEIKISLSSIPTSVRISSYSQNQVAVGLNNGQINVYSLVSYNLRYTLSGCHYSSIKDIKEVQGNGWISLDSSNYACRWNSTGSYQMRWSFNYQVYDMSVTFNTYGYAYVGFNFGDQVYEYYSETSSSQPRMIYNASSSERFASIQYDGYGTRLFTAMNNTYVYAYNCTTGLYMNSVAFPSYTIKSFKPVNNGDIVFTDGYYVYRMNSSLSYTKTYVSSSLDTVIGSQNSYEFVYITMYSSSSSLKVYDSSGSLKQTLNYAYSYYRSIDASTNFLVYADSYGYLGIAMYDTNTPIIIDITFPVWAIVFISVAIFLALVVAVVICVVKSRKRRLAMAANGYNRFNETQGTAAFIPNPQPYNPVNPQFPAWNTQNQTFGQTQNWNPQPEAIGQQNQIFNQPQHNQGWNNQVPIGHPVEPITAVQPTTQNPYQAIQPTNSS